MNFSKPLYPPFFHRIISVWYRHMRVYARYIISNALPPFLEPLIFLVGIGLGLGRYIQSMDGFPYIQYLASGLLVTTAMFTASFECTFGTFIRLEFDKVYDGMLAAPITANNLLVGELLWAATKGFVFTFAVLIIVSAFGVLPLSQTFAAPFIGFFTGAMFGALGMLITSFVNNLNHFNFFFSGFLSPMFFFAGVVFPVDTLPNIVRPISEALPLTHAVRLVRVISLGRKIGVVHLWDAGYILLFTVLVAFIAIIRLKKRLVD